MTVDKNADELFAVLSDAAVVLGEAGRPDMAKRMQVAAARLRRPATVVAVAGTFKSGKSSLVNALLGQDICPTDPHAATSAVTVFFHADEPTARARRAADDEPQIEPVAITDLGSLVVETGEAHGDIESVEVGLPAPVLDSGLVLVDTPGAGGLDGGGQGAVLEFAPIADAIVFCADGGAELAASDLEFVAGLVESCPTVLVAVTKVDLYPHWRAVLAADVEHLAGIGITGRPLPVSAALAARSRNGADEPAKQESGLPALRIEIDGLLEAGRSRQAERAVAEAGRALDALAGSLRGEIAALTDPDEAAAARERLEQARTRVEELKRASSRWSAVLQEGFADLRAELEYDIRMSMRTITSDIDDLIDDVDPVDEWDRVGGELQRRLTELSGSIIRRADRDAGEIATAVGAMLDDAGVEVHAAVAPSPEFAELASLSADDGPGAVSSGLDVLRGSYGGVLLFGMVARFAALPLLGPAALGAGAIFGAKQFKEMRHRRVQQRRQEAKRAVRKFIDTAQLELGRQARIAVQAMHRDLRDRFADRVAELQETHATALRSVEESAKAGEAEKNARVPALQQLADRVETLGNRLESLR